MEMIDAKELRGVLASNIRRLRKTRNLAQYELAQRVGVSAVYFNRIEQGLSSPSAEVLFAIADALEVDADTLRRLPLNPT